MLHASQILHLEILCPAVLILMTPRSISPKGMEAVSLTRKGRYVVKNVIHRIVLMGLVSYDTE